MITLEGIRFGLFTRWKRHLNLLCKKWLTKDGRLSLIKFILEETLVFWVSLSYDMSLKSFLAILPVWSFQHLQASCSCHSKHISGIYFSFRSILGFIIQHGSCASSWFSKKWLLFIKSIKRSVLLFAAYGYCGSHHQGGAFVVILSSICILSPSHH